ncbi:hypothetical protein [Streptomyces violascens]|uniref:hypothetical protein n=1 Tax=Streptomyces violascens TaxID=67381 RepID=UPI0036B1B720
MSILDAIFGGTEVSWVAIGDRHLNKALNLAENDDNLRMKGGEISLRLQLAAAAHQRARLKVEDLIAKRLK